MEQAGFKVSFASDIDPKAAKTYLNNRRYLSAEQQYVGDIKVLNDNIDSYRKYLENIELVCGGPPCHTFGLILDIYVVFFLSLSAWFEMVVLVCFNYFIFMVVVGF